MKNNGFLFLALGLSLCLSSSLQAQSCFESCDPEICEYCDEDVTTLILINPDRMTGSTAAINQMEGAVNQFADLPTVNGLTVNIGHPSFATLQDYYDLWDLDQDPDKANAVLFAEGGIQDIVSSFQQCQPNIENIIVVGGDDVIPMARIDDDDTILLPESEYVDPFPGLPNSNLTDQSTVGQALASDKYLSDDPLAVCRDINPQELDGRLFLPDLSIGRLVETPEEITASLDAFTGTPRDLSQYPYRVLLTGYEFLVDSADRMKIEWENVWQSPPLLAINSGLVARDWMNQPACAPSSSSADCLEDQLRNGGNPYAFISVNGHADHYSEGVPNEDPFDFSGLNAAEIYGKSRCDAPLSSTPVNLENSVVVSVGCHGGLPVPGCDMSDVDHSMDMPQTYLNAGAMAYIANTGYAWALDRGVGKSERLPEILTDIVIAKSDISIGEAVRLAKRQKAAELFDITPYDSKTSMEWTLYGFPMYRVKTGEPPTPPPPPAECQQKIECPYPQDPCPAEEVLIAECRFTDLTQLNYLKHDSEGTVLDPFLPLDCEDPNGCYVTLEGYSSETLDAPIQPKLIRDATIDDHHVRGVLWLGGEVGPKSEEWEALFAQPSSNRLTTDYNLVAIPRIPMLKPGKPNGGLNLTAPLSNLTGHEGNVLVLLAGLAEKPLGGTSYSRMSLFNDLFADVFYLSGDPLTLQGSETDFDGPTVSPSNTAFHSLNGVAGDWSLRWDISAQDGSGVWRIVVVYHVDGSTTWDALDLVCQNQTGDLHVRCIGGIDSELVDAGDAELVTYFVQAVDVYGNVSWLSYVPDSLPTTDWSGVVPDLGLPVDVLIPTESSIDAVFVDGFEAGDLSAWSTVFP